MANSTTVENRGRKTTVALKVLMAVTGLFLVLFLMMHAFGNLKMFAGQEAYNYYADWLKTGLLYPFLPKMGALWIFRFTLLFAVIAHIASAVALWKRGNKARGHEKYKVGKGKKIGAKHSYTARTMRYGGIIIALFVVFHLLHYTVLAFELGGPYDLHDPYNNMLYGFSIWWVWLVYLIAMGAIAFHLAHGVWSALATLGLSNRKREVAYKAIAGIVGVGVLIAFMLPPTAILLGLIP